MEYMIFPNFFCLRDFKVFYHQKSVGPIGPTPQGRGLRIHQDNAYNDTYSVHKEALMLCRARLLCLLSSWEHLTVSAAWYQLLTSSPTRWAGPPFSPHINGGPISPRVHAHLCPHVRYNNREKYIQKLSLTLQSWNLFCDRGCQS